MTPSDADHHGEDRQEDAEPADARRARTSRREPIPGRRRTTTRGGGGRGVPGGRSPCCPRCSAPPGHRDVDDTQLGHADQQLEEDLETDRAELDAVDEGAPAEEEPGERIGALAGFVEEHPRDDGRSATDQATAPRRRVLRGSRPSRIGSRRRDRRRVRPRRGATGSELGRMLQVGVHDADVAAARHAQPGDHRGAQAALAVGAVAEQAADRGSRQPDGRLLLRHREQEVGRCRRRCRRRSRSRNGYPRVPREMRSTSGWRLSASLRVGITTLTTRPGPTRLFGSHGQRIGAKPARGADRHGSESRPVVS